MAVAIDDARLGPEREGDHLGDEDPCSFGAQFLGQRVAPDEGDRDEHRVEPDVPRPGDHGRHRLIRPDHDHRLGRAPAQFQQRRFDRGGIPRIDGERRGVHVAPVQRAAHPAIPGPPEGIVLVQHRDALDVEVAGQPRDHFLGFLIVGRPQIDDVGPLGVAQERGTGERRDVRHVGVRGDRCGRARRRRPHRADQREDLLLFDQAAGVGDRGLGLVRVVERDQFEPAPVHAAPVVGFPKGRPDAPPHVLAEFLGRAAEGRGLSEHHAVLGHADLRGGRGRQ